jgi:DNA-binding response OmpR family regulator
MHILIVEDTYDIGNAMKVYLDASGYQATRVTTLEECYKIIKKDRFDCVIMDRMLPDGDWAQACNEIKSYKNIPVIMATAKGQIEDKVQWFEYGADDYLTKPFDLKELDLRIKAVTKRNESSDMMHRKDITIDLEKKEIYRKDKLVHLTNKEFLIVALLLTNHGQTISRTNLLEEVRGSDAAWENDSKLDVYISTIRRKLRKEFIQTEKGVGYRISL